MKLLEVVQAIPPETFLVRHIEALAQRSDLTLTIASKSPRPTASASRQPTAGLPGRIVYLPNFDTAALPLKLLSAARGIVSAPPTDATGWNVRDRAMLAAFAAVKPDLVHFQFAGLARVLSRYVTALGIPFTVSVRGSDVQVDPLRAEATAQALCAVLTQARAIHTVTDDLAALTRTLCGDVPLPPLTTIRTCLPLPTQTWSPPPADAPLRLVSVGRLHWRKALHDLVRALAHLPDAELDIIGDGEERDHLLYLIDMLGLRGRVRLHGSLPYDRFVGILLSAHAYVQSSIAEGFSNATAEALALGMPVYATDIPGTDEVIRDGVNGWLIPVGDPRGIADVIRTTSADPAAQAALAAAGRASAVALFGMEAHATAFSDFFASALRAW